MGVSSVVNTNNSSENGSKSLVKPATAVGGAAEKTEEQSTKEDMTQQIQEQKPVADTNAVDKVVEETARLSIEAKTNESKVGEAVENATVTEKVSEVAKETVTEKDI